MSNIPEGTYPRNAVLDNILNGRHSVSRKNQELIDNFIQLFRRYLTFLRIKQMDQMHTIGITALKGVNPDLIEWKSYSPEFLPLAQALLVEFPKVCAEEELICWYCPCRMFNPVNLLDHLVHPDHFTNMKKEGPVAEVNAQAVQGILGKLSCLLKRTGPVKRDEPLKEKGETLFKRIGATDPRLRPTRDFVRAKLQEYKTLACGKDERAIMLANVGGELNPVNDEYFMRVLRKWFNVEANRERFMKEYDEHVSTGVPHCAECKVAFVSKDEFYKHVTGYTHARLNHTMFGGIMIRLARGSQDWDITM